MELMLHFKTGVDAVRRRPLVTVAQNCTLPVGYNLPFLGVMRAVIRVISSLKPLPAVK